MKLKPFLKKNNIFDIRYSILCDARSNAGTGNLNLSEVTDIAGWLYEVLGTDYFVGSTWVDHEEFAYSHLTHMVLPEYIQSIEQQAFNKSDLTSIELNEGLTHIRALAFNISKLKKVVIPNSVVYIGTSAFANTELDSVEFQGYGQLNIEADDELFSGNKKSMTIILPKNKELAFYGDYDSLDNWIEKYNVKFV